MASNVELSSLLLIAKEAALLAGHFLSKSYAKSLEIDSDSGRDVKLRADKESEAMILDYLKGKSDFSILSEENGMYEKRDQRFTWIVDPLDGSLNYMRGIPICCVSVGLRQDTGPVLVGAVYDFNNDELFTGIVDQGAWLNDISIRVSSVGKKEKAVVCTGFPVSMDFSQDSLIPFVHKVQEYKKVRLLGSAALSLAYVAAGRADAYMENDIKIWDVAAGIALVKAAGGVVQYNSTGQENTYNVKATNKVLAPFEILKV